MSVFLSKDTFTVPDSMRDTDEIPEQPFSPDRTPSILDVTSASITSDDAPAIVYDTDMEWPPDAGLYCIRSIPKEAMPITDRATMTSITENGENRTFFIVNEFDTIYPRFLYTDQ